MNTHANMDPHISPIDQEFFTKLLNAPDPIAASFAEDATLEKYRRVKITKPVIYVGLTSSSEVAGAFDTYNEVQRYLTETGVDADVVTVGSLGLCSFEPMIDVQLPGKCRIVFQQVTPEKVSPILDGALNNFIPTEFALGQYRQSIHQPWPGVPYMDEISFFHSQRRLLLQNCGIIDPENISDYLSRGGYTALALVLRKHTHEAVCRIVEQSKLRGRGGGGFPTAKKWLMALQAAADQKYFICNADESDPGAFMDRLLMESDPHRVIEGLAIGAYAIGASKAIIYTRNRYRLTVERLEKALKQAYQLGLLGHNILDSGYNLDIVLRKGPGAYVCGEETALIRSLEGKRGMPESKPPYPAEKGLFGKPTVVNNIETLANVPTIIQKGGEWFAAIGTPTSTGTKIFSVAGKINSTCLVEVPMGTPLSKVVELAGGVPEGRKLKAVQIGGASGGCAVPETLNVPIDFEALVDVGLNMGSGGVTILDDTVCMIDMVKYFMHFIQKESCGKCIPCRDGSRRMLEILENITRRPVNENGHNTLERFKGVIHLESLAEVMRDTSLCGLGQTAPNPVLSTLKHFREEYEEHIFDRKCRAGVCRDLRTFYVDVEKCTGCTACARKCPTNAIIGTPRSPYFIIEDKCIGCGVCQDVCKFSAVFFK